METLTLTEFAGLNTKSPPQELSVNPVESPNIVNAVMEEGTIFCRPGQNTFYDFNAPTDKVNALYFGKLGNTQVNIAQVGTKIYKQGGGETLDFTWWNPDWGYCRKISIINNAQQNYINLLLDLRLPAGFNYDHFKTLGEDIRFIPYIGTEPDVGNYPNGLDYEIKKWKDWNKDLLPTTNIIAQMSLVTQPTVTSKLEFTVIGATTWGNITITGIDINNNPLIETLTWTTNGTKITVNDFKSVNVNGISTSGFTGGQLVVREKETMIYVKIPEIKAKSTIDVYMYCGNATAPAVQKSLGIYKLDLFGEQRWPFCNGIVNKTYGDWRWSSSAPSEFGVCGEYTWGYSIDTEYQSAEKIKWECQIKATDSSISKAGIVIKFNETATWCNAISFGLVYNPPDFPFRGIEFKFFDTSHSIIGDHDTSNPYSWSINTYYIFELTYNKANKTFIGQVKTSNGIVILNKTLTLVNTPAQIYPGVMWEWRGGFYVSIFEGLWDNLYNFLPDTVTILPLSPEFIKPTGNNGVDWIVLYPDLPTPIYPVVSPKPHQILAFAGNYVFITEDYDVLMWNGLVTKKVGGGKKAKFGLVHKNRLWLFNFPGLNELTRVEYSNINKMELAIDWQTDNKGTLVDNKEYIHYEDGFEILAAGIMSDSIAIDKGNGIWLWYGDIPNQVIKKLNIDVGCIAQRTIAQWENGRFFVSTKGVHFLRGSVAETPIIFTVDNIQSDNLAEKIMPTFKEINSKFIQNSIGVMWNNRYYVALPYQSSEVNDILLILDYKRGWISEWIPPEPITSMFVNVKTNELYIGTTKGKIRLQGNRNYNYDDVLQDDGIEIFNRYDTGNMDLGIPTVRKRLRLIELIFSGKMTLELSVDGINKVTQELVGVPGLTKKRIPILAIGRFFKLGFSNLSKQLHSVTLHYDLMRT